MKDSLEKGRKFCVGEEWFGRNDMGYRDETKVVQIGKRQIGGGNPILIQSMCNTKTEDVKATVEQILALEHAGCDIIRVAVPTMEAAAALTEIKRQIHIPLVADIHFDYRLAIAANPFLGGGAAFLYLRDRAFLVGNPLFQGGDDPFLLFDGIAAPLRRSGKGGEQEKEGQYAGGLHHGHSFSALPCSMRRVIWSAS